jgi:hypothetical protein
VQAGPAPFLELAPAGAFGAMSIQAGARAVLNAADMRDGGVCLRLMARAGAGASIVMDSDSIRLRAARYNFAKVGIQQDARVTLNGIGPAQPLQAAFHGAGDDRAELCFARTGADLALLEPIDIGGQIRFGGVLNPSIKIEGYRDLPARVADRKTDLTIAGNALRLSGVFLSPAERGRSSMRITIGGEARSIRQGEREILPSWLEDISEDWWTKRGLWLLFAGMVLVAFRKLIDRALDLLLKRVLPE